MNLKENFHLLYMLLNIQYIRDNSQYITVYKVKKGLSFSQAHNCANYLLIKSLPPNQAILISIFLHFSLNKNSNGVVDKSLKRNDLYL